MERYGFFFTSDSVRESEEFTYLHGCLYEQMHQCLRIARDWETSDEKNYFKLLNNSEIIKYVHEKQNKKKIFGYLFLSNDFLSNNMLFAHSYSLKLYHDILECIFDGKSSHEQTDISATQKSSKIGYFVILNDDELVAELHAV